MKLFIWPEVEALKQCCPGEAYALACTKEQAMELILSKYHNDNIADANKSAIEFYGYTYRDLREELNNTEPEAFDTPVGFYVHGSA